MGRITSTIGLASGIPIQDTVEQLLKISARPRDLVISRTQQLDKQQVALTELTASLLKLQFNVKSLGSKTQFSELQVTSSNSSLLSATITGDPVPATYQFTPLRQARTQQLISSTFLSDDAPLGTGSFSFRTGARVDEGRSLALLNNGAGVQRGKIRITDRSGASAEIDLTTARTVDDVVEAVNTASGINASLEVHGDSFRLVDHTNQTTANLRVQEVGGTTAADLGLASIDVAADQADGDDVLSLYDNLALSQLNDGLGVRVDDALADLSITLRDGSEPLTIDFARLSSADGQATATTSAANGETADLTFQATQEGSAFDGYVISFVNDDGVTAGSEVVEYDTTAKTLNFRIDEGFTTADDIIAALAGDATASADFTATKAVGDLFAAATTTAAAGATGEVVFTAKTPGAEFDGYTVSFVHDAGITAGNEFVDYDTNAKTITFHIVEGTTTADQIPTIAQTNAALVADFEVSNPELFASGTTTAVGGLDAQVQFTALNAGADYDDVEIIFQENAGIAQGEETVLYDDTGPTKTLTFQIAAGATTANDIIAALEGDATAGALFSGDLLAGSNGQGVIDATDTATTDGGGSDGLISSIDSALTSGGTSGLISASDTATTTGGSGSAGGESTLGDIIETINAQGGGRILAELSADGDRIVLTDLTEDRGGTFSISSLFNSNALEDLGLDVTTSGGTITGKQLLGGLNSVLIRNLNGGAGLGDLGLLDLTDRSGANTSVDLSSAETLQDIIDTINDATLAGGVAIQVEVNDAHNGILLSDASGSTAGPLIVASGDATNTAEILGLATDGNVTEVNGAKLRLQTVSRSTLLEDLNGGKGIARSNFKIIDSDGLGANINVGADNIQTVGDLIDLINIRGLAIQARINDNGDGIALIDTGSGGATIKVTEGQATTAADLNLLGAVLEQEIDGETAQVIDGTREVTIELTDTDTLDDLITKLNASSTLFSAFKLGDGSAGSPFRISLVGTQTGDDANLIFDTSGVDFSFEETVRAQDALLLFGGSSAAGSGILTSSSDNRFENVLPGVRLTVKGESTAPVQITVSTTDAKFVSAAQAFVDSYNALQDKIESLTFFNESDQSTGILHGFSETLRLEADLADLATGRYFGVGDFQSLEVVGIGIDDSGKLSFDQTKLDKALATDHESVVELFTDDERGVAAKFDQLIERLAGEGNSILVNRARTLADKIDFNLQRIQSFNIRLENERERLLTDFTRMEIAISKLQNSLAAINQIQALPPLTLSNTGY